MRAELSKNGEYHIPKERYLELKHYCLQYKEWKKAILDLDTVGIKSRYIIPAVSKKTTFGSSTEVVAMCKLYYAEKIRIIVESAENAAPGFSHYILRGVTEGVPYHNLETMYGIPCSRATYYRLYRKFFWLLDRSQFLQSL